MPYINIKITDEQVSKEQKQQLIEGVTRLMVDVLNKNPETTRIVIDEVHIDNWGLRGEMYSEILKTKSK